MLDKIKTHNQPRILLQLKEFLQKVHYQLNQLFEIETFFATKRSDILHMVEREGGGELELWKAIAQPTYLTLLIPNYPPRVLICLWSL